MDEIVWKDHDFVCLKGRIDYFVPDKKGAAALLVCTVLEREDPNCKRIVRRLKKGDRIHVFSDDCALREIFSEVPYIITQEFLLHTAEDPIRFLAVKRMDL